MMKNRWVKVLIAVLLMIAVAALTIVIAQRLTKSLNPNDAGAVFGGKLESGYQYAGYMVSFREDGRINICGVTYLASTLGITAAHCVIEGAVVYVGENNFKTTFALNYPVKDVQVKPGWNGKTSDNDLAIVKLDTAIPITQMATTSSPALGCNYTVVGYGRTEKEDVISLESRERKSAVMCITRITKDLIYLRGEGGGICFGDSGSPIFETGTNRLVGVISAIVSTSPGQPPVCDIGNEAVAVRVDRNSDFIDKYSEEVIRQSGFALCGESCGGNTQCADGLACSTSGTCFITGTASCVSTQGDYCSTYVNAECSSGNRCVANNCVEDIGAEDLDTRFLAGTSLDFSSFFQNLTTETFLLYLAIGSMIFIGIVWFTSKRSNIRYK